MLMFRRHAADADAGALIIRDARLRDMRLRAIALRYRCYKRVLCYGCGKMLSARADAMPRYR